MAREDDDVLAAAAKADGNHGKVSDIHCASVAGGSLPPAHWCAACLARRAAEIAESMRSRLATLEANAARSHAPDKHCETCICGRRAPVQADSGACLPIGHPARPVDAHEPGTIAWAEHVEVWSAYAARYGRSQDAERIAERGGFSYGEIVMLIGRKPRTWAPRGVRP